MLIVALGPGPADAVPVRACAALRGRDPVYAPPLDAGVAQLIGAAPLPLPPLPELGPDATVAAPDAEAHRLARRLPEAETVPSREALRDRAIGAAVGHLAGVGAHLRRACPWDREQTAETIAPHTIEEAFEVAEAVAAGDPAHLADELGDLLFQAVFQSQLLEEAGDADLAAVARGQADKLVSRHPHVYGDAVAASAAGVVDLWDRRKREERADQGIFHDLPAGLPALAYALKAQRRAASVGFVFGGLPEALAQLAEEVGELTADPGADELGDVLFAALAVARVLSVDPELALRATAQRFRGRVEAAAALAAAAGQDFERLTPDAQLGWYARARAAAP